MSAPPPPELILASQSPYRRELLARLRIPFRSVTPRYREETPGADTDPTRLVVQNALGKALSLLADHPGALIIGSDQIAVCGETILTKPHTAERAVDQLLQLAGREHRLLTGLALVHAPPAGAATSTEAPGETALTVNHLRMRPLTRAAAEAYVRAEQPLDCAGAYKSEALGIALFEYLRGDDPTAIIGLPLIALLRLLRRFGHDPLGPDAS